MPRVAILMETSLEVSRNILRGIIRYIREHDNWMLDFMPGGIADQHLPDNWHGNGIIARIPSVKEAARLAAHPGSVLRSQKRHDFLLAFRRKLC